MGAGASEAMWRFKCELGTECSYIMWGAERARSVYTYLRMNFGERLPSEAMRQFHLYTCTPPAFSWVERYPIVFTLSMSRAPAQWPSDVQYIRSMAYSADVSSETREFIKGLPQNTSSATPGRGKPLVAIRKINDAAHPANGQMGLFARSKINPSTFILDYLGEIHVDDRDSDYDLSLCRRQIDEGKYLNVGVCPFSFILARKQK